VLGHWDGNMRVRLDAARQHNLPLGLDDSGRLRGQSPRRGYRDNRATLDPHIALSHVFCGDYQAATDYQIEHRAPPHRVVSYLSTWTKVLPQFMPLENQLCLSSQTVGESLQPLCTTVGMTHKPKMVTNNTS